MGPRLGRYAPDGSVREIPAYSIPWATLGAIILWVGWWGFNGGSLLSFSEQVAAIIANTNLAASAGGIAAFVHGWLFQEKQRLAAKFLGGILGGLVAITAGCNVVSPLGALAIGIAAGVVHNVAYEWILVRLRADDPVGAVAVHGFCGVWGTLAVALFGAPERLAHPRWEQLGVQALGALVCLVWAGGSSLAIFKLVHSTVGLRVSPEEEIAGVDITGEVVRPLRDDHPLGEDELRRLLA